MMMKITLVAAAATPRVIKPLRSMDFPCSVVTDCGAMRKIGTFVADDVRARQFSVANLDQTLVGLTVAEILLPSRAQGPASVPV